jgi:hypothetical protein
MAKSVNTGDLKGRRVSSVSPHVFSRAASPQTGRSEAVAIHRTVECIPILVVTTREEYPAALTCELELE